MCQPQNVLSETTKTISSRFALIVAILKKQDVEQILKGLQIKLHGCWIQPPGLQLNKYLMQEVRWRFSISIYSRDNSTITTQCTVHDRIVLHVLFAIALTCHINEEEYISCTVVHLHKLQSHNLTTVFLALCKNDGGQHIPVHCCSLYC